MVFDWFRRKKKTDSEQTSEKAREEQPSPEKSASSEQSASGEDSSSSATAPASQEDYLAFAKAAYANLKSQQATASAAPMTEVVEDKAPPDPTTVPPALPVLPDEPKPTEPVVATPAATTPAVTTPAVAEPEITEPEIPEPESIESETGDSEVTEPDTVAEPEVAEPEVTEFEATEVQTVATESVESAAAESGTVDAVTTAAAQDVEPVAPEALPPQAEPSAPIAPAPEEPTAAQLEALAAAATTSAESAAPKAFFELAPKASERLEVLEAEAIEEPAPEEEIQGSTAALDEAARTFVPDFDDGFVWSTEVLAAQGRRVDEITVEEITWLQKLRRGLGKTRLSLINQLKSLVGKGPINDEAVEEIEALLLQADVGIAATDQIVEALQNRMRDDVLPPDEAVAYLKQLLREILSVGEPDFAPREDNLNIWLMVGVNGAGKTTTLGKLAHLANKSGYKVLVAAGDTFRAAAVEQVQIWGDRAGVEVIANQGQNTDPAAVVFDAITAAQSRESELLLVDTAGRLQNKKNLMDELSKIRRIVDRKAPDAKVESLLVLDATLGQNGLRQAQVFAEAANLSGVVLTKLDGTAKGGVALAVAKEMGLPIRFIGVGEGLEDLRPFSSYEFVEALVSEY
ncbi:MAG: signal recognition particle-docking protein FtsY [Cyanobacteria bacterium P01_E01_bin.45]